MRTALRGSGLQSHHLIEQRFRGVLNVVAGRMQSVAVTPGEHQVFTNAWRTLVPYGTDYAAMTVDEVYGFAAQVYQSHPAIMSALGLD